MQKTKKQAMYDELKFLAVALNDIPPQETLKALVELFSDADLNSFKFALRTILKENARFPKPKDIYAVLSPNMERLDGDLIAGQIIDAIKSYGLPNLEDAKINLGELAWRVVELFGGWQQLCQIQNNELNTVRAQLRDLSLAVSTEKQRIEKHQRISTTSGLNKISFGN